MHILKNEPVINVGIQRKVHIANTCTFLAQPHKPFTKSRLLSFLLSPLARLLLYIVWHQCCNSSFTIWHIEIDPIVETCKWQQCSKKVVHFSSSKHFLSFTQDKTKYSIHFQRLHRLLLSRLSIFRKASSANGRLKYERAAKRDVFMKNVYYDDTMNAWRREYDSISTSLNASWRKIRSENCNKHRKEQHSHCNFLTVEIT